MKRITLLSIYVFLVAIISNTGFAVVSYNAVNYGMASADEQDAFNRINAFRADPQNELYEMFVGEGYGGTKATFDSLLNGQTTHTGTWWADNFGGYLATWSMDAFGTVPSTLNAQFAALPAGPLPAYTWSDNMGWAAHQYSVWVENDAGASGAHTVAGAPALVDRFTEAGSNGFGPFENVARDWILDVSLMHMGFAIDWGSGIDGIQNPPGHRNSMLNTASGLTHAGIGIVDYGWTAGEYTQTQHFGREDSIDPIFYGYVTDFNGIEYADVDVEVFDAMGNSLGTTITDARGAYTIQYAGGTPDYAVYTSDFFTWEVSHQSDIQLGMSGQNYFLDAVIPEPSSFLLILMGSLFLFKRKRC